MASSSRFATLMPEQSTGSGRELEKALQQLHLDVDDVVFSEDILKCRVCERPCIGDPFCSFINNSGFICSDKCFHNFWADVTQSFSGRGKHICLFPCCSKECYEDSLKRERGEYCGRHHRDEHKRIIQQMYGCSITEIPRCQLSDCRRICSLTGTYGSSFHNFCCKRHAKIQSQRTEFCDKCPQVHSDLHFYNSTDPFYEFTNFYEFAPFKLDGKRWKTSEHYFQAQKFIGTPYEEVIRTADSPRSAFELARKYSTMGWQRKDWEDVKLRIMYKALLAKFAAHQHLRLLLHSTGQRKLVEHTYNDSFWGDGGTGDGKNNLGNLLENVRRVIRGKNGGSLKL